MSTTKNVLPPRRHLIGSHWSAAEPVDRDKHFRVVGVRSVGRDAGSGELVELEAVLSRRRRQVPREELVDPSIWRPDWR